MRAIDADALIEELNNSHFPGAPYVDAGISIAIGKVLDAPTIEPEWKTGKWIKRDVSRQIHGISCSAPNYQCSVCKKWWFHNGEGLKWYKFCPECGADMRQREENK